MGGALTRMVGRAAAVSAALAYMTLEGLTEVSDTTTSWLDVASGTFPGGSFTPSNDYIGFWSVAGAGSSTASGVKARVTLAGSDVFTTDAITLPRSTATPQDYMPFGGMFRHQPGSTPVDAAYKIQVTRGTNAATYKAKDARLSLLKMGADDHYAENIARQTFTDTTANKTATVAGTITFTPGSSGNYIIFASMVLDMTTSSSVNLGVELTDGTNTTGEIIFRPQQTADRMPAMLVLPIASVSGSKTVDLKFRQSGTGATAIAISEIRIFALREDRFANVHKTVLGSNNTGIDTTYTSALSQTFTPAAADHLTISAWPMGNNVGSSDSSQSQFSDGGTIVNEYMRSFNTFAGTWDSGFMSHRIAAYAASSRTQEIDRLSETSSNTTTIQKSAAIVTLDLAGLT